jgi:two-component system chemotaxis response regulator CheB
VILRPIRVFVVDDSSVVRGMLIRALETDVTISVVGTAMHGEAALRGLRATPADVVLLDVEMPVMDGLAALPLILRDYPGTRVVMVSALTQEGAQTTMQALALGAAGCIAKPNAGSVQESVRQVADELIPLVKALGSGFSSSADDSRGSAPERLRASAPSVPAPARPARPLAVPPELIVIGTSTGGPNALAQFFKALPRDIETPILIVQHMPPLFTPMLAKHIERDAERPAAEGRDGELIERGHVYVAPGDFHMEVTRSNGQYGIRIQKEAPEHYCRPSVNPLFRTAAHHAGNRLLAIMLTGMGDDGIEGTRDIVGRGGRVIAQDEASSVVWGMPGAIVRAGLADQVLPLSEIPGVVAGHCRQGVGVR